MNDAFPVLFAGLLNSFSVRVEPWVSNWLTPVWILSLGVLAGVVASLALWLLGFIVSRIAPLSHFSEKHANRLIAGIVLGLVLVGAATPLLIGQLQQHWAAAGDKSQVTDTLWTFLPATAAAVVAGIALVTLASRRTMEELPLLFQEGPLFWIAVTIGAFALFGVLGTAVIRDPDGMIDSLVRWPSMGTKSYEFIVQGQKGQTGDELAEQALPLSLRRPELRSMMFASDESLMVSGYPSDEKSPVEPFVVSAGEPAGFAGDPYGLFGELEQIDTLYVRNYGDKDADLKVTVVTGPAVPEMLTVPIVGAGVLGLFLAFLALWGSFPKLAAIAFATAKSEMNTPLYMLLSTVGALALFVFMWLPYNTFGEDIKMLKFAALDWMLLIALVQTIWSASSSVAEEVEGRTALTVLSKPVGRRDFILGKFLGISWIVLVMFTVFSAVTLISVAYKPIFDVKEGGKAPVRPNVADPLGLANVEPGRYMGLNETEITWQMCHAEMASTIPAILLVYCETVVMAAVSVAISTRIGLVANFIICFAIYAVGHLTPLLVQSGLGKFEAVTFMGQLISAVLPVLEYFDVKAAIAKGTAVSLAYVGATFVYTALCSAFAMLLALVLFEDRDLA
jgi:hypothetical protein